VADPVELDRKDRPAVVCTANDAVEMTPGEHGKRCLGESFFFRQHALNGDSGRYDPRGSRQRAAQNVDAERLGRRRDWLDAHDGDDFALSKPSRSDAMSMK
jgi:hypothetical protein